MDLTLFLKKHKEIISVDDLLLGKDELTDFAYSFFKNRPFLKIIKG